MPSSSNGDIRIEIPTNFSSVEAIVGNLLSELDREEFTIDVRRANLLQDALKEARKKKFSVNKKIKVSV